MSKAVPEGWAIRPLNGKVEILSGYPFKSSLFCDDPSKMGVIRIRDLVKQSIETFYAGDFDDEYVVRRGDILIGMDGDFNIVKWKTKNALLNQRICKVEASKDGGFDSDFLFHSLVDDLDSIHSATGATTVKHLSVKDIKGIEKAYPPLPEQQKIAAILSSVDDVIEKTRAQIDKLKDLKTGMMQELLTKGIGSGGVPHTEFKDSSVGRIPSSWDVHSLGEVCDLQVGYAFKSTWFSERGIKLLRGDNVGYGNPTWERTRYLSEEKTELFRDYLLSAGDLIIGMDRTFTNSGTKLSRLSNSDTPALLVQRVGRFIPNNIRKDFLWHLLRSTSFANALKGEEKGMDIPHLSKSEILTPLIALPPMEEQRQIAVALTSIDDGLATKEMKLHRVKELKKALMQDLLTGKVRVKVDQKEPAVA